MLRLALVLACGAQLSLAPTRDASSVAPALRVLTYNIHGFGPLAKTDEAKARVGMVARARQLIPRYALEIGLYEPNIISLQEAAPREMVEQLAQELGMRHVFFPGGWKGKGWPDGIAGAVLTSFEIVEHENCPLIDEEERPKDIFSRHFGRVVLKTGPDTELAVFSAHLLPSWKNTTHIRKGEIRRIGRAVARERAKERDVIVLGDMNLEPDSPEYAEWKKTGLLDCYAEVGEAGARTCPANEPKEHIDYVFVAGDVAKRLKSCRVLFEGAFRTNPSDASSFALSDHVPVLAAFE